MSDLDFDWDDANVAHIAEHGITPADAEHVINNEPLDLTCNTRKGEERIVQLGRTEAGRILVVVTTWRQEKVRVVTAYPAIERLRKVYAAKRGKENGETNDS